MTFQQVIIVGRAGDDPKEGTLPSGMKVVNLSLAVTEGWTDKQTNERKEKTTWFRCAFYSRLAEIAQMYIKKGNQVMVIGTVEARGYLDKNQQPAASLDLRVRELRLLGSKNDGSQSSTNEYSYDDGGSTYSAPRDVDDIPF